MGVQERYQKARWEMSPGDLRQAFPTGHPVDGPGKFVLVDYGYVYEADTGENVGLLRAIGGRALREIKHHLEQHIEGEGLSLGEGLSDLSGMLDTSDHWPANVRHIMVYAVPGGNEGHYVHVDVRVGDNVIPLFLLKTFHGMDHALRVANVITHALHNVAR